jgi:hypothetical protein
MVFTLNFFKEINGPANLAVFLIDLTFFIMSVLSNYLRFGISKFL